MNTGSTQKRITIWVLIILGVYFGVAGLVRAKGFLLPIIVAGLLSMLLQPLCHKLEEWKINRVLATFVSVIFLLIIAIGFNFLLINQAQKFLGNAPEMLKNLEPRVERLNEYISEKTGVSTWKQKQKFESLVAKNVNFKDGAFSVISNARDFLQATLLVFVYTFFFLLYRNRFFDFILLLVSEDEKEETREIIHSSGKIAQHYLLGRLILIVFLAFFYFAGFSAFDLRHTLFLSGLVAVLSLVPYVGNVIGLIFALGVGLMTGMSAGEFLGILIVFAVAQLIESYVLEPYVVGKRVELNAVMSIIVIVLGGAVWGVAGVIIALPVVGIIKVICDHISFLQPFGYLLGGEDSPDSAMDRLKSIKDKIANKV